MDLSSSFALLTRKFYLGISFSPSIISGLVTHGVLINNKSGSPWLDGKHTVFGKVTKGLDIMRKMESLGSGSGSTSTEVKISSSGAL